MPTATPAIDICAWCREKLEAPEQVGVRRVRCDSCGVQLTRPVPDAAELDAAYSGWYRPERGRFSGPGDRLLRFTRGRLARRLDRIAPPGAILDIGSGDGALLDALRARGREAVGTEREGEFGSDPVQPCLQRSWAAIVFWHSLEHLPDPGERLRWAAGALLPGGVVVVAVPNVASLQAGLFGDRWLHLDLPRHLVHLTSGALRTGLIAAGFRLERVGHLRSGQVTFGMLHGLVGALPPHLDLYDAIRRPEARSGPLSPIGRLAALVLAALLLPLATVLALVEILLRRGGTVYVEARVV